MSEASERINRLAAINNANTYLEIGVAEGKTFHDVQISDKTAVDPEFLFEVEHYKDRPGHYYYKRKSNDFFNEIESEIAKSIRKADFKWDIVYIDGLHTYEQAMADFKNSIRYTNDRTIWIFDDTVPSDPWAAIPNMDQCYFFRHMAGIAGWAWQGDVYKCIFELHDFYHEYSYATIFDRGNPQTIVWKMRSECKRPRLFKERAEIEEMDYFTMLPRCAALHPMRENELFAAIGKEVIVPMRDGGNFLPYLVKPLRTIE